MRLAVLSDTSNLIAFNLLINSLKNEDVDI